LTGEDESDIEEPNVKRSFAMSPVNEVDCSCAEAVVVTSFQETSEGGGGPDLSLCCREHLFQPKAQRIAGMLVNEQASWIVNSE
jgi:hypothetical protein